MKIRNVMFSLIMVSMLGVVGARADEAVSPQVPVGAGAEGSVTTPPATTGAVVNPKVKEDRKAVRANRRKVRSDKKKLHQDVQEHGKESTEVEQDKTQLKADHQALKASKNQLKQDKGETTPPPAGN